jgi:hypothetical protein
MKAKAKAVLEWLWMWFFGLLYWSLLLTLRRWDYIQYRRRLEKMAPLPKDPP